MVPSFPCPLSRARFRGPYFRCPLWPSLLLFPSFLVPLPAETHQKQYEWHCSLRQQQLFYHPRFHPATTCNHERSDSEFVRQADMKGPFDLKLGDRP